MLHLVQRSFEEEKRELEQEIKAKEFKLEELRRKKLLAEQKFSNQVPPPNASTTWSSDIRLFKGGAREGTAVDWQVARGVPGGAGRVVQPPRQGKA
jgi:hypothetical protein